MTSRELVSEGIAAARRMWWLTLALPLLLAALLAEYTLGAGYEARVRVAFKPVNVIQLVFNEPRQGQAPPSAGELEQEEVIRALARGTEIPPAELRSRLSVLQEGNEFEAVLIAEGDDAKSATDLVNAWASIYAQFRSTMLDSALEVAREEILERIDELLPVGGVFQRREIARARLAVEAAEFTENDVVRVGFEGVGRAGFPVGLAVVAGALLGLLAVLGVVALDPRLHTAAAMRTAGDLPVVGSLRRARPGAVQSAVAAIEARLYAHADSGPPDLTLLAAAERDLPEGGSLGRALATSMADARRSTLLIIDAPEAGDVDLEPVLARDEELPGPEAGAVVTVAGPGGDTAGPERWERLLQRASSAFEVVVVVSSALPERSGAITAAKQGAAILGLAVTGRTRRRELEGLRDLGTYAGNAPVGLVAVDRGWSPPQLAAKADPDGELEASRSESAAQPAADGVSE